MGRPEFENDFKEKLKGREIKPGADSWNRLQEQLTSGQESLGKTRKWWPGMVAAGVGLLLILGLLFKSESDVVQVVEEHETGQQHISNEVQYDPKPMITEMEQSLPIVSGRSILDQKEQLKGDDPGREEVINQEPLDTEVSQAEWIQQDDTEILLEEHLKELGLADLLLEEEIDDAILWQKLDEVLAQAGKIQGDSGVVSDAEIDALLLLAAEDISNNRPELGVHVNPDALLYEVERELEESFRLRVFELLKQGLEKTRTAVVNRMN